MFKKTCPTCRAKNSKERTVCAECGTPLDLGRVDGRLTEVPPERKPNLPSTMRQSTGWKRRVWFWVGVTLLSISALWWFIIVIIIAEEPEEAAGIIAFGLILSVIPIAIGVYCVRRGRKASAVGTQQGSESIYVSQSAVTATQETRQNPELTYASQPAVKPSQPYTGFFGWLKEKLRDKTRDRLCADLCNIGVDARMAARGRDEEKVGGKGSLGIIHIPEGAIRWINVRKEKYGGGQQGSRTYYYTEYGVPDARLESASPTPYIRSIRKKTFPLFGKVADVLWEGEDYGTGVISRLNSDQQLKEPIMESRDVTIEAIGDYGCWIMSTQTRDVPSRELWTCYQAIAQHLLAESTTDQKVN